MTQWLRDAIEYDNKGTIRQRGEKKPVSWRHFVNLALGILLGDFIWRKLVEWSMLYDK